MPLVQRVFAIKQYIAAGSEFNGADPAGALVRDGDRFVGGVAETVGGKFNPQPYYFDKQKESLLALVGLEANFGTALEFWIRKVDPDGSKVLMFHRTAAQNIQVTFSDGDVAHRGTWYEVETNGGSALMFATMYFDQWKRKGAKWL